MKRFTIIPVLALAFIVAACEKHPVGDAPEGTQFGPKENAEKAEPKEAKEAKPAGEAAKPEGTAATPEAKPGEAPKFFPEEKK